VRSVLAGGCGGGEVYGDRGAASPRTATARSWCSSPPTSEVMRGSVMTMSAQVLKCCDTPKLYSGVANSSASAATSSSYTAIT
jgi:hypothetical protein